MNNYTGALESISDSFKNFGEIIKRSFGMFSEREIKRMQYLCAKGFQLKEAKIIVKLENGWPVTLPELEVLNNLIKK